MKKLILMTAAATLTLGTFAYSASADEAAKSMPSKASIHDAIANTHRGEDQTKRDEARKPAQVLAFIDLGAGDTVLDFGAGGGYWSELFSTVVGDSGKIYAHQRAGERFEKSKEALTAKFSPFGNINLMPVEADAAFPVADNSVDTIMLSYILHHLHYSEETGEALPDDSTALFNEYNRVLKPGGTFIVIEHVAIDGSSRADSAGWHRTPPATAKADIVGVGFEFVGEAPTLFANPDDDLKNIWFKTGLSGKTTSFVHKYRKPK